MNNLCRSTIQYNTLLQVWYNIIMFLFFTVVNLGLRSTAIKFSQVGQCNASEPPKIRAFLAYYYRSLFRWTHPFTQSSKLITCSDHRATTLLASIQRSTCRQGVSSFLHIPQKALRPISERRCQDQSSADQPLAGRFFIVILRRIVKNAARGGSFC